MKLRLLKIGVCMALLGVAPSFAQFVTFATPTSSYTGGTTVMSIPGANFSTTSTLTDGTETLTFSSALSVRTVPSGGWATWNSPPAVESHTPKVLFFNGQNVTVTLSLASPTVGFEIEPNGPGTFSITATFFNGATNLGSIPLSINASSGALLAAASSATPITSVVVAAPAGAGGFAMAQFRYGTPPVVPTVTGVSPASGPTAGGTSVTVTGTGFTGATAVRFGATAAASFTVNSATSITATSAAGTGTVDITVTTPGGTSAASAADQFTFSTPTVPALSTAGMIGLGLLLAAASVWVLRRRAFTA